MNVIIPRTDIASHSFHNMSYSFQKMKQAERLRSRKRRSDSSKIMLPGCSAFSFNSQSVSLLQAYFLLEL